VKDKLMIQDVIVNMNASPYLSEFVSHEYKRFHSVKCIDWHTYT